MNSSAIKTVAEIAIAILDCFSGKDAVVLECHIKEMTLCVTCETNEAGVDNVIDELLDAGYIRSTVEQYGEHFVAALVLTLDGWRHIGEARMEQREATRKAMVWADVTARF